MLQAFRNFWPGHGGGKLARANTREDGRSVLEFGYGEALSR